MNNVIKLERPDDSPGIAVIIIDNPPVNAIGLDVHEGLLSAFDLLSQEPSLKAVVIAACRSNLYCGAGHQTSGAGSTRRGRTTLSP
jgi:3-hydroxyacyl-CoA dehydrogenase